MKKIAFLILAHNDPDHLGKLVEALDYKCDFYIHIDQKSEIKDFKTIVTSDNVYFLKKRVSIHWGDISMIKAQINLIGEALKKNERYSHLVFLSGSCFPIKNKKKIYEYFSLNPSKEFIKFVDMRESPEHHLKKIKFKWFKQPFIKSSNKFIFLIDKFFRFFLSKCKLKNNWNEEIIPYCGSQWIALTVSCCEYIYNYHLSNNDYYIMNKYTFAPDEHYFHTIVGNSKFMTNLNGEQKLYDVGANVSNFHIIHPSLAKWYTLIDWEEICNSEKIFVRKVNSKTGSELVAKIKKEILPYYNTSNKK